MLCNMPMQPHLQLHMTYGTHLHYSFKAWDYLCSKQTKSIMFDKQKGQYLLLPLFLYIRDNLFLSFIK